MRWRSLILAGGMLVAMIGAAAADPAQWTASKVRGGVEHLMSGTWTTLNRGDVVSDGDTLRTSSGGFAELTRGQEVVSLAPGTVIQLHDRPGQQYTKISQGAGQVSVIADARNVIHFEVDTPYLAAVVKGTVFTVTTQKGRSSVAVNRGRVQVTDGQTRQQVLVEAGQTVTTHGASGLGVSGTQNRTNGIPGEDSGLGGSPASTLPQSGGPGSVGVTLGSGDDGGVGADVNVDVGGGAGVQVGANANVGGGSGVNVGVDAGVGGSGGIGVGVDAGVGNGGVNASVNVGGIGLSLRL